MMSKKTTRRQVLKLGAAVVGGVSLHGSAWEQSEHRSDEERLTMLMRLSSVLTGDASLNDTWLPLLRQELELVHGAGQVHAMLDEGFKHQKAFDAFVAEKVMNDPKRVGMGQTILRFWYLGKLERVSLTPEQKMEVWYQARVWPTIGVLAPGLPAGQVWDKVGS